MTDGLAGQDPYGIGPARSNSQELARWSYTTTSARDNHELPLYRVSSQGSPGPALKTK